ncbi:hypothetical protein [Plantactinospora sp. CA-290183]|uniref:hypothetical protein n=1 Tax=Plantactinospora sp. CA-290183 TaxID=3240006 RepID=UPI003D8A6198
MQPPHPPAGGTSLAPGYAAGRLPSAVPLVWLPDPGTLAKQVAADGSGFLRRLAALAGWGRRRGKSVDGPSGARKAGGCACPVRYAGLPA